MKELIDRIKRERIDIKIDILLESLQHISIHPDQDDDFSIDLDVPLWIEYRKDGEIIFDTAPNLKEIYLNYESLNFFRGFDMNNVKKRIVKKLKLDNYIFNDFNLNTF